MQIPGEVDTSPAPGFRARVARRWFELGLGLIGVVAFAIPAWYTYSVRAHQRFWGDPRFFYYWPATQFAEGHGILDVLSVQYDQPVPSASHPPGFIVLLAAFYRLGAQAPQSMRYLLCVIGAATVVLVGLFVGRLIGRRAGLIAAAIAAVYPNIWISSTLLMSETMVLFGLMLALVGFYRFHEQPRWPWLALASVGLTVAASARPEFLVLYAVAIVPVIWSRRHALANSQRLRLLVLAGIIPLFVFGPWFAYNTTRFERPVLMSTGFGQTLLTGACDEVFYGKYIGYWSVHCTADSRPPDPPPGEVPDQSVLDAYYREQALQYYSDNASQVPLVVLARLGRMFGVYQPTQQNFADRYIDNRGSYDLVRVSQWSFWLLALASIPGIVHWRRRGIPLYPMVGIFLIAVLVEAITFGNTRYRVGIDLCAVFLAATTLDLAFGALGRRIRARRGDGSEPESDAADGSEGPVGFGDPVTAR